MSAIHIPILRLGEAYRSLDTQRHSVGGETLEVSVANSGLIRRDLRHLAKSGEALRAIPCETLVGYMEKAAELYLHGNLPWGDGDRLQSPADYAAALSQLTGLPHSLGRSNMSKVHAAMSNIRAVIAGLTRGLPHALFDTGVVRQDGLDVNFFPQTDSLGVLLPSNSPGVNSLWLPALAMKIPVVLKPGREDPLTPFRLIQAMIAAGFPREAFGFYPTTHDGGDQLLFGTGRAIAFGNDTTLKKYAPYRHIQVHGSGRSKILIGDDYADDWEKHLDVIVNAISANGGRSCINCSSVLMGRNRDDLADALARKLAAIEPLARNDPAAILCGFANPKMGKGIDERIEELLKTPGATDLTAKYRKGPRLAELHGQTFLRPTLIVCDDLDHPLANTEFMFPFASILQVPQEKMIDQIGESLVVSAFTHDREWCADLMTSTNIERLNLGPYSTMRVQWEQPHEGNLFEFLYRRRALQGDLVAV
ncbi:MAG: aldehyde dehydrogenase family protein [Opitutaceae bacterium]|nr:aldehyde dehydrogenase family protein [Opitutaceae bacterium]